MKRKILYSLFLILFCITAGFAYVAYRYYGPPRMRKPYLMKKSLITHQEDTLRIAYIGDSWAFFHRNHDCQITKILEDTLHRPIKVHSYGICGLTSKEIYENIFDNSDFKHFLEKKRYNYCFISAGINDTYKKLRTDHYQQSIYGIVQFFLYNNIRPIILEIPDYDIQKCYVRQLRSKKTLRHLSMYINNTSLDCKQDFRNALNEMIAQKGYNSKVSIIRYQSWNGHGSNDLNTLYLPDGLHLNNTGYMTLDSAIVNTILAHQR